MNRLKARARIYAHWLLHNHRVEVWTHPLNGGLHWFCTSCVLEQLEYFGGSVK